MMLADLVKDVHQISQALWALVIIASAAFCLWAWSKT